MSKQLIFDQVSKELDKQLVKWGVQDHPSLNQKLLNRKIGCTPLRMAEYYEIPTENVAKYNCELAAGSGNLTWAHILIEEVAEAIAEQDESVMRVELIQCVAVLVSWIESIDRRIDKQVDIASPS